MPALAIVALQQAVWGVPLGIFLRGVLVGGLTALLALGMALTYRSNRILNFAHADLGLGPVVLVYLLTTAWGWPYLVAVGAGGIVALLLGAVVELAIIRRFARAPRLLLTVGTLGLAQLLTVTAILLPRWFGEGRLIAPRLEVPWNIDFLIGSGPGAIVFDADEVVAAIVIPLVAVALAWFLRRSLVGMAVRGAADSSDRAQSLGIPVKRLQTVVWALASLLAFIAILLRANLLGLPFTSALSFAVLLRALAALLIGRLTDLVTISTTAVALGVLETGISFNTGDDALVNAVLAGVIAVALLARRPSRSRIDEESSSWRSVEDVRPVPPAVARLPRVRAVRWSGAALLVAVALVLPHLLSVDRSLKASAVLVYAILGLSIVVLTGWSGQVSLGQIGFFAFGAAVGAKATIAWGLDLTLAIVVSAIAGALAAVVVGLPALRVRGLYLAVTTFAFSLAATAYLLDPGTWIGGWVPTERVPRQPLLGRLDIDSATRIYYVILAVLVLCLLGLRGIRASRTGRVLHALRDNERGAQAFSIDATRAKLTAFALSGALAAIAGCLFVHHQQALGSGPYDAGENFPLFAMVIVGGVASPAGAVLGAIYLQGAAWFLPDEWRLLSSGAGVLLVLLIAPGGLGGLAYRVRDLWLRREAARAGIDSPGLAVTRLDPSLLDGAAGAAAEGTSPPAAVGTGHDAGRHEAPVPT